MGFLSTEFIWLRKISLCVGLCACVCVCVCVHLATGVRQELTLAALGTKGRFVAFVSWKTISKMSSGVKWKKDASWDSFAMASGPDPLAGDGALWCDLQGPRRPEAGPVEVVEVLALAQLSTCSFLCQAALTPWVCEEPPLFETEGSGFLILPRVCAMG